jgi:hypothetical protein
MPGHDMGWRPAVAAGYHGVAAWPGHCGAHGARAGATGRGHRGRSRRGGAGGHGLPTAPLLRGRGQGHKGGGRGVVGKMSNDAAH